MPVVALARIRLPRVDAVEVGIATMLGCQFVYRVDVVSEDRAGDTPELDEDRPVSHRLDSWTESPSSVYTVALIAFSPAFTPR